MERRIEVQPGEVLRGAFFPTVWDNGPQNIEGKRANANAPS
jgi:hypothetical protein